jgi:hypothetical protein
MQNTRTKKFIFSILTLVLLHIFFWFLYVEILTKNGLQRIKAKLMQESENQAADFWIMGDSHPMLGINPDSLGKAFNWAGTSEYYFLTSLKLKHALENGRAAPEMIILPLDLHSFSAQGNALLLNHELDDAFWCSLPEASEITGEERPSGYLRWWLTAKFFPYSGQYYRFVSALRKEEYQFRNDGFTEVEEDFSRLPISVRRAKAQERFKAHFGKYQTIDSLQVNSLRKIAETCRNHNIRLVLVSFPLSLDYADLTEKQESVGQVKKLHQSIAAKETVLDFRNAFLNQPHLFSDPDHLNKTGASALSGLLRTELRKIRQIPVSAPTGI